MPMERKRELEKDWGKVQEYEKEKIYFDVSDYHIVIPNWFWQNIIHYMRI